MANNWQLGMIAGLDGGQSRNQLNQDIKGLARNLDKLKLYTEIDKNQVSQLQQQLKKLQIDLNTVTVTDAAINGLVNKINAGLQNISISNINIGNIGSSVGNQAQQMGQQIGNNISQGVSNGVEKAKSEIKSFSELRNFSELNKAIEHLQIDPSALKNYNDILDKVKQKYAKFGQVKITNEQFDNGILEKFKVNIEQVNGDLKETKSFMMSLNDDKDTFVFDGVIKGSESVVQHLDKTKNAVNQTAEAINALKDKAKSDKIQLQLDDGTYDAKVADLTAKTQQWTNANGEARISVKSLEEAYGNLINAKTDEEKITNAKKLDEAIKETTNSVRKMNAEYAKDSQVSSIHQKVQEFYDKNTATHKKWGTQLKRILSETGDGAELTKEQLSLLTEEFNQIVNSARQAGKLGLSFFDSVKQQVSKFVQWFSITDVVMEGVHSVKKLIDVSKELNTVQTKLTMATGVSKSQLKELTDTYSKLADKLSSTTTDVTTSATEWLKQGKSLAEINALIEDTIVLSKVGDLSAEESTKYLTAAMKGYQVSVEDTLSVVDKLSAVDMASATDVGGLAEGMSEVANNANIAGISMDKLLGYLATIGEVTQSSMSEVGTSLNAIFSRMGNIKLSRLKDYQNNGEDLSNVETVLRGEGINLRDETDSFRNFGEVLDETANRWNTFSEVSQRAIASAFAGTNHMENFLVLMNNYGTALDYTETSLDSTGQAMEKFSAYEKSVEAHAQSFTNAVQSLADTAVDSGLINFFIDLGTSIIKFADGFMKLTGIIGTIGISAGITAFVKNFD